MSMIVAIKTFKNVFNKQIHWVKEHTFGSKIYNTVKAIVFEKTVRKAISREKEYGVGEISTLSGEHCGKIGSMGWYILDITRVPIDFICAIVVAYALLGFTVIPTVAVMICCGVLLKIATKKVQKLNKQTGKVQEKRYKMISEVYTNIRYVKMAALENYFLEKLLKLKEAELKLEKSGIVMEIFVIRPIHFLNHYWSMITMYAFYLYFGGELELSMLFAIESIFGKLKGNVMQSSHLFLRYKEILVSFEKINNFLISDEVDWSLIEWNQNDSLDKNQDDIAIQIDNGNFFWVDEVKAEYLKKKKEIEEEKDALKKDEDD